MEELMSETQNEHTAASSHPIRLIINITTAVIFILGLGYAGGYFIFPGVIQSAYQDKNCEFVISMSNIYSSLFPFVTEKDTDIQVRECALYALAVTYEGLESWSDAYHAYGIYDEAHPNGLFRTEAREHISMILRRLAAEEVEHGKYPQALVNINNVLHEYADTNAFAGAVDQKVDLYLAWGEDLRTVGDFVGAERVSSEFLAWSESINNSDNIQTAQRDLAETYLAWGLALQHEEHFEGAMTKYDLALETDPDPSSTSGPAAQAEAARITLYKQWGDHLMERKDFTGALGYYEMAASLTDDEAEARDIIAQGYSRWADGLAAEEDFIGALILLDVAQDAASTDSMKESIEEARSDGYFAFSSSSGEQAQRAMRDAAAIVCEHGTKPSLPLFGLDEDRKLAGIYGVDDTLPDGFVATTPGSMYFVACIETVDEVVDFQFTYGVGIFRIRLFWDVSLVDVATGDVIESQRFEGAAPPPFPANLAESWDGNSNFIGLPPEMGELVKWLQSEIR